MNDKRTLTLRVAIGDEWLLEELEKRAKESDRSLNWYVCSLLKQAVPKPKKGRLVAKKEHIKYS